MKKSAKILLSMLFASLLLVSCGNVQEQNGETSTQTAKHTDSVQTVAKTDGITETEPATTAPETDEPDSTFDIEQDDAVPYKLLTMTFDEIEKEYGTLGYKSLRHGGIPVYDAKQLPNIEIDFRHSSATYTEGMPIETSEEIQGNVYDGIPIAAPDDIPTDIYIRDTDRYIYPGLKVGMSAEEVKNIIPDWWSDIGYIPQMSESVIAVNYDINDCHIQVWIKIHDSLVNEVFKTDDDYKEDVIDDREEEMLSKFFENPQGSVTKIVVSH